MKDEVGVLIGLTYLVSNFPPYYKRMGSFSCILGLLAYDSEVWKQSSKASSSNTSDFHSPLQLLTHIWQERNYKKNARVGHSGAGSMRSHTSIRASPDTCEKQSHPQINVPSSNSKEGRGTEMTNGRNAAKIKCGASARQLRQGLHKHTPLPTSPPRVYSATTTPSLDTRLC